MRIEFEIALSGAALNLNVPALPTLPSPEPLTAQNATPAPAPAMQPNAAPPVISKEPVELHSGGDHPTGTTNAALSDMALAGGPVARRDGALVELTRYQQSGTIRIDGDTVTQQIGRKQTAEYSLDELAAHSKKPEYFENTMRSAAKHDDSVTIDVHDGVARVTDPTLEHRLPQNMPLREPILQAAVKHDIDPVSLAAVGVQETHLGADYLGSSFGYNKATHRGDIEPDSKGGHRYGPWQYDDQKRAGDVPRPQAELNRIASDPYYAADKAASTLNESLAQTNGNVKDALHLYNSGSLAVPSRTTDWGPSVGKLHYEESAMRYYGEIVVESQQQRGIGR